MSRAQSPSSNIIRGMHPRISRFLRNFPRSQWNEVLERTILYSIFLLEKEDFIDLNCLRELTYMDDIEGDVEEEVHKLLNKKPVAKNIISKSLQQVFCFFFFIIMYV